jgi:hypothetical protein
MRDTHGTFSGTAPADMDTLIDEVQAEYPSLAYMGPVDVRGTEWSEEELDTMGPDILAALVGLPH